MRNAEALREEKSAGLKKKIKKRLTGKKYSVRMVNNLKVCYFQKLHITAFSYKEQVEGLAR